MKNLNRKVHPAYHSIKEINIPTPEISYLDNGIKLYTFNAGTQNVVKVDIVFNAGSWYQQKPLAASFTNEMLIEGSENLSSKEIAEKLDFFGAFIQPSPSKDFGNMTLYTLIKYLPETIKILEDIIKKPTFPEKEFNTHKNKRKQQFQIELGKVANIARREFNEQLFGLNHPYGKKAELADYENITREDLIYFHNSFYHPDNCKIILSGKINHDILSLINKHFGNNWEKVISSKETTYQIKDTIKTTSVIEKEDVSQSAIRVGKVTINKDHPDFHKLKITNTLLGGYFGSRLMKKIREEKGYTYGISSVLVSMKHAGYMVILSEVGKDVAKNAIEDIFFEINNLKTELVSKEELALVKNYMLGDLLRAFDGAFEISSAYRTIIDFDLDHNYLNDAIKTIHKITSEDIKEMANIYFDEKSFVKTIAGKYD